MIWNYNYSKAITRYTQKQINGKTNMAKLMYGKILMAKYGKTNRCKKT